MLVLADNGLFRVTKNKPWFHLKAKPLRLREDSNPVHKLILRNMRWLENVFDNQWLTEKLTEVLGALSVEKQKDLIGVLPEIITDDSQDDLTENLIELLEDNKDLTVHVFLLMFFILENNVHYP